MDRLVQAPAWTNFYCVLLRCVDSRFVLQIMGMPIWFQFVWLLILAIPVACVSWTVTHEEVFREPRDYCQWQSKFAPHISRRKFFYLLTCEYCFSHYVAALFLVITRFKMLYADWRGYLIALFALVWVANQYMSIYNRLRLDIKHEQVEIRETEKKTNGQTRKAA
jgi:Na+-transporting methylmalonyl-CoA/oxaloacetate decarboxylase gamma subunit